MLRIGIIGGDGNFLDSFRQRPLERGIILCRNTWGDTLVFFRQDRSVCGFHLYGQNINTGGFGSRIFLFHDEIGLAIRFLQQLRCHQKGKKLAAVQNLVDALQKTFTGGQKLIIPDSNIVALGIAMDHTHQLVGIAPIIFSVTQENIGIKGVPDPFGHFIADQHGFQKLFQLLFIGNGSCVSRTDAQVLECTKVFRFAVQRVKLRLHHNGKNGHAGTLRIGKILVHGPIFLGEQSPGHRNHK